jgi:LEA14-like dessication related protein
MNLTPTNIALGVLLVGTGIYALKAKTDKPHLGELKLRIKGVQLQGKYLVMNVQVLNPSDMTISVKGMQGDFFANDKKVAGVNMVGDYMVKPKGNIMIPLIAVPVMPNLLSTLFTMFNSQQLKRVFFTGAINANGHSIPLQMSYTA